MEKESQASLQYNIIKIYMLKSFQFVIPIYGKIFMLKLKLKHFLSDFKPNQVKLLVPTHKISTNVIFLILVFSINFFFKSVQSRGRMNYSSNKSEKLKEGLKIKSFAFFIIK